MSVASSSLSVIPRVSQLCHGVLRILGCNPGPMTLQGTNTYIVGKGKNRLLIDTADGQQPEYFNNLKETLSKEGISLSSIILTHWHHDHVGGVENIVKEVVGPGTAIFKYPRQDAPDPELPTGLSYTHIKDGHTFEVEGATLEAIYTPGHTTDHVVLHLKEENILFSGDCVLGEGTAVFEDLYDYMISLNKILEVKPKAIYPAHGAIIEAPVEKLEYYISHRNQRESQIYETLAGRRDRQPMTAMDIVKVVYTTTPATLYPAAAKNVSQHLRKLEREEKVVEYGKIEGQMAYKVANKSASL